jgi:hypothetical protein
VGQQPGPIAIDDDTHIGSISFDIRCEVNVVAVSAAGSVFSCPLGKGFGEPADNLIFKIRNIVILRRCY